MYYNPPQLHLIAPSDFPLQAALKLWKPNMKTLLSEQNLPWMNPHI